MIEIPIFLQNGEILDLIEIRGNSTFENSLIASKFELNSDVINNDQITTELVNKSLKMTFCFRNDANQMFPLRFFSQEIFKDFKNILFKSPITFLAKINSEIIEKENCIKTLLLIAVILDTFKFKESEYKFRMRLKKKLKNCVINDSYKYSLKVKMSY